MSSGLRTYVPKTGRGIEEIMALHDLTLEQFAGKIVLDIGCGYSDLAADLEAREIDARVIGLDMGMKQLSYNKPSTRPRFSVVADISKPFPIADESVDIVIATYSYPMWATSSNGIARFYKEVGRVAKQGGLVSIFPVTASSIGADEDCPSNLTTDTMGAAARQGYGDFSSDGWSFQSEYPELLQSVKVPVVRMKS